MASEGRADAVMLGVMAGVAIVAAPLGAVLLQWGVGWTNQWLALDPAIPAPGFGRALFVSICCGVCIWLVNGVATGVAEGLVDGVYGEYLGQAVAIPLGFVLLTLLYMWLLPATLAGAGVVSGMMHLVGLAVSLLLIVGSIVVLRIMAR